LSKNKNSIVTYEYASLYAKEGKNSIAATQLEELQKFYGEGVPYYSLINNGIKFCQYVGVIQVGNTIIEVLPKADKDSNDNNYWRTMLIDMLRAVGNFRVSAPSSSNLKLKSNAVLHLYFEIFLNEVEYLLHQGLSKKYRKTEGNVKSLKGSLLFSKQIQQNSVHIERFYTRHTTYDTEHLLHIILYKTLSLLKQINTLPELNSKIGMLLLNFPEMPDERIIENTFDKLVFNRNTERYRSAIEIAKLLLLNYHPDVSKGRNHILALMFDMNRLWEQFVYVSLKQGAHKANNPLCKIGQQVNKKFWEHEKGNIISMKPDVVITHNGSNKNVVLDTKWKNLNGNHPSHDDLRQLYVYHSYFEAEQVALVYPGNGQKPVKGSYLDNKPENPSRKTCYIIEIPIEGNIKDWQQKIYTNIIEWSELF
jgi:5-methylcytosine-specific restriction enzyme subunit McrC